MATADLASSSSFFGDLLNNQTFYLVAFLVIAHLLLIAALFGCLWSQTPKKSQLNKRWIDEQREEFKESIAKKD